MRPERRTRREAELARQRFAATRAAVRRPTITAAHVAVPPAPRAARRRPCRAPAGRRTARVGPRVARTDRRRRRVGSRARCSARASMPNGMTATRRAMLRERCGVLGQRRRRTRRCARRAGRARAAGTAVEQPVAPARPHDLAVIPDDQPARAAARGSTRAAPSGSARAARRSRADRAAAAMQRRSRAAPSRRRNAIAARVTGTPFDAFAHRRRAVLTTSDTAVDPTSRARLRTEPAIDRLHAARHRRIELAAA